MGLVPGDIPGYDPMAFYSGGWRTFRSSNEAVITHESLHVNRPEQTTKVKVDCSLESERFTRYWTQFTEAGNTTEAEKWKDFAPQAMELELTVLGTSVDTDKAAADAVRCV